MDLVIPAAGTASRMGGLPKFLLPIDKEASSLVLRHVRCATESGLIDQIWIPTRKEYVQILERHLNEFSDVNVFEAQTKTMTESLKSVLDLSRNGDFSIVMPDTYFAGELPYRQLFLKTSRPRIAVWKIRSDQRGKLGQVLVTKNHGMPLIADVQDKNSECDWEYAWGALQVSRSALASADSSGVPGDIITNLINEGNFPEAIIVNGEYFDCGTTDEYFKLIRNVVFEN